MPIDLPPSVVTAFRFIVESLVTYAGPIALALFAWWLGLRSNRRTEFNSLVLDRYASLMKQANDNTFVNMHDLSIEPHIIEHLFNPVSRVMFKWRTRKYREAQKQCGQYVHGLWINDIEGCRIFCQRAKGLACSLKPR